MQKEPLVSVIMNCYNGEEYLRDAINSVINQTYKNWEIILWDNQSTDRSAEIYNSYKDSRLKYYLSSTHTQLYEARVKAVEKTNGEYLAFLDIDDWWLPLKLEQQVPLQSQLLYMILEENLINPSTKWLLPALKDGKLRLVETIEK